MTKGKVSSTWILTEIEPVEDKKSAVREKERIKIFRRKLLNTIPHEKKVALSRWSSRRQIFLLKRFCEKAV